MNILSDIFFSTYKSNSLHSRCHSINIMNGEIRSRTLAIRDGYVAHFKCEQKNGEKSLENIQTWVWYGGTLWPKSVDNVEGWCEPQECTWRPCEYCVFHAPREIGVVGVPCYCRVLQEQVVRNYLREYFSVFQILFRRWTLLMNFVRIPKILIHKTAPSLWIRF